MCVPVKNNSKCFFPYSIKLQLWCICWLTTTYWILGHGVNRTVCRDLLESQLISN
jgi:hypothetical protein